MGESEHSRFAGACAAAFALQIAGVNLEAQPFSIPQGQMVERTFESRKQYPDPFNDVDVDVIFSRNGRSWRVPTFWRGGQRWTVRFSAPEPGTYDLHLASTDKDNPDLNGHLEHLEIGAYLGTNSLWKHGMVRVSANHRYFEHADGTPFFWLGDTWWMGLSDRLPWSGFQKLARDRKEKGFTVVAIAAGLVPIEEACPQDPGCGNEGGQVWEPGFARINPAFFDAADRRITELVDCGLVPEIEGAWHSMLAEIGVPKMKQHWRYIVARYGAYPVLWNLADEVNDPPSDIAIQVPERLRSPLSPPGWTDVAKYIRSIDPYHHPLTVNEFPPPLDIPLQDESLTDFDQLQPGHYGWPSVSNEVVQLNLRYSRTDVVKPVVVGEIGYELIGGTHLEDFQRVAYWLSMLNGAAGFTYGAAPTYEINNPEKPLHRIQYSFLTWDEGMNLPGSYQVGLSAKLLRQFRWWEFTPLPETVIPRGTTLMESHSGVNFNIDNFDFGVIVNDDYTPTDAFMKEPESIVPGGEWKTHRGTFRRAYAAGIRDKIRVIYTPSFGLLAPTPPTVLDLKQGVVYKVYYWEPMLGIKFDLGSVEIPAPGAIELREKFSSRRPSLWTEYGQQLPKQQNGALLSEGETISVISSIKTRDCVVAVSAHSGAFVGLLLRYVDIRNYIAAVYSPDERKIYLMTRIDGVDSRALGSSDVPILGANVRLKAEVRSKWATASITDGVQKYSTQIVDISQIPWSPFKTAAVEPGGVGLWHRADRQMQRFTDFEVRRSAEVPLQTGLNRKLYDAKGMYRGEIAGPAWDTWAIENAVLLNAYRPDRFPTNQDWVLVLEASR